MEDRRTHEDRRRNSDRRHSDGHGPGIERRSVSDRRIVEPLRKVVTVTGAAGQIGYAMLFRIASGEVFGENVEIDLKLLELEQALPALNGVKMELDDGAFPNLASITTTSSLDVAFGDSDWAFLVGSVPRKAGMERNDLLNINGGIFTGQGKALDKNAKPTCKVLVVGNPCNTNALIAKSMCKNLEEKNFFAMTMLDELRATSQLAQKAKVSQNDVKNLGIWGNHSSTQYPDFYHATIKGKPATQVITDENWLKGDFIKTVQQRGAAIIKARGASSAASAANAAIETAKRLSRRTPDGQWFSVAVSTNAAKHAYGIKEDLMFSYPVRSNGSDWEVVEGIEHNDFSKEKIKATEDELIGEREAVKGLLPK